MLKDARLCFIFQITNFSAIIEAIHSFESEVV